MNPGFLFVLLLCLLGPVETALAARDDAPAASAGASSRAIRALVGEAYAGSPELKAAFARLASALERVPQAGALPDPTVGYEYFIEQMNARQRFRVQQMFPGFGIRESRTEIAEAGARSAADAVDLTAADLRQAVHEAVADWVLVERSRRLVEANLNLIEQLEDVALQRYRAGDSSQADVLRLQMEADTLAVELQSWQAREPAVRARLNAVIGREPEHPVPTITELPRSAAITTRPEDLPALIAESPDLRRSRSLIHEAERSRELARKASRPDLMLGVEYMDNKGMAPDEVMAMVSVSVPIWQGRYRAARREATEELRAAEADHAARHNRLHAEARMALFEAQDAARQVALFEDALLPRARQTLSILEADYRTGRSAFLDLLEAQRTVLDLELALVQAQSNLFSQYARWERITLPAPEINRPGLPNKDTSDE